MDWMINKEVLSVLGHTTGHQFDIWLPCISLSNLPGELALYVPWCVCSFQTATFPCSVDINQYEVPRILTIWFMLIGIFRSTRNNTWMQSCSDKASTVKGSELVFGRIDVCARELSYRFGLMNLHTCSSATPWILERITAEG